MFKNLNINIIHTLLVLYYNYHILIQYPIIMLIKYCTYFAPSSTLLALLTTTKKTTTIYMAKAIDANLTTHACPGKAKQLPLLWSFATSTALIHRRMSSMLDDQDGPLRKKQKLSNVQLPNLVPPETASLFETLANECVRHIAFHINKQFYDDARHKRNGWRTIGKNEDYVRSAPARILGLDVETIATVNNRRQLARLSVVELVFSGESGT